MTVKLANRIDTRTADTLYSLAHNTMVAKPGRTIERAMSHVSKRPSLATADALKLLTRAWYGVREARN